MHKKRKKLQQKKIIRNYIIMLHQRKNSSTNISRHDADEDTLIMIHWTILLH